jgi:hypothetical protein
LAPTLNSNKTFGPNYAPGTLLLYLLQGVGGR